MYILGFETALNRVVEEFKIYQGYYGVSAINQVEKIAEELKERVNGKTV